MKIPTNIWLLMLLLFSISGCSAIPSCTSKSRTSVRSQPESPNDPTPNILQALDAKKITEGQAQQYLWASFLGTSKQIPSALYVPANKKTRKRSSKQDAHMVMSQVYENWDSYSSAEQWGIALSLGRVSEQLPAMKAFTLARGGTQDEFFDYFDSHTISFCKYDEWGPGSKKIGFYDEFSAELPDCNSRTTGVSCRNVTTAGHQRVCEFNRPAGNAAARCHRKRFFERCEAGWLDNAYAAKREEIRAAAQLPFNRLEAELGWDPQGTRDEVVKVALLHSVNSASVGIDGVSTVQTLSDDSRLTPYVLLNSNPVAETTACGEKSFQAIMSHELFHAIHTGYHHGFHQAGNTEAIATWFEDVVEPTRNSEQVFFERYPINPGIPLHEHEYAGALALRALAGSDPQKLFSIVKSDAGSYVRDRIDFSDELARLPLSAREELHQLSEQTFGFSNNPLENNGCPLTDSWKDRNPRRITVTNSGSQTIRYTVPELGYVGRMLEVHPDVKSLQLTLSNATNTRTSILYKTADKEGVVPLEPGPNQLCFVGSDGERDCSCQDAAEEDLIPTRTIGLVSTQLTNTSQLVTITAESQNRASPIGCWRMTGASGKLMPFVSFQVEKGPVIHISEDTPGLPGTTACTLALVENHTDTKYTSDPSRSQVSRCTIRVKTAIPINYSGVLQSATSASGTLSLFGPRKPYREGKSHQCTPSLPGPGQFGVTDQGNPFIGVLASMMSGVDGGMSAMNFQITGSGTRASMVMTRNPVSRDGYTMNMQAQFQKVHIRECAFSQGVWQRAIATYSSR